MGKYEEALERAKQGLPIDEVFPELKESEDERIRKFIMECINELRKANAENAEFNGECSDALAYLEKQKDERELSFIEGKMEGVRQTCQEIKDAMSLFEPKDLTPFEFTFRDYIDSAIRYCLAGEGYQQYIKEWAADLLNLERQNEQKLEWSDTDMKEARNNLISVCRDWECGKQTTLLPIVAIRARYFLEHLTEPKPAEWGEEDDALLKEIVSFLRDGTVKLQHDLDLYAGFLEKKFKSLRPQPHWRPSEVQMKALKLAYEDAFDCPEGGVPHLPLQSLYQDLQKLLSL